MLFFVSPGGSYRSMGKITANQPRSLPAHEFEREGVSDFLAKNKQTAIPILELGVFRSSIRIASALNPQLGRVPQGRDPWLYRTCCIILPVNILLNEIECRVLGSLIEKEVTTPEYYPLSLNALVNACNQKSNREPVMNLNEAAVREALHSLDGQSLVRSVSATDSRVTKYEHRLQEAYNFYRHETAILCVLLLRGPQTPGELRTRAERMHSFDDLSAVQSSLQHLMKRGPPLVKVLPRQPGTKEARYAHLFSGDVVVPETKPDSHAEPAAAIRDGEQIARLEDEVMTLRNEVAVLRQQFALFKKQFE
jgi:uncharacterized protein YceH (UPF0502 family)